MEKKKIHTFDRFPVGFWNYVQLPQQFPSDVKDWADCGMTVAMSPEFDPQRDNVNTMRAILDAAREHNIKVILWDKRAYIWKQDMDEKTYRNNFSKAVKDFGDHPALLGFFVGDEPDRNNFQSLCKMHRIQKEIAPDLIPFCNLLPWYPGVEHRVGYINWKEYLDTYVELAKPDILSYDCYSQMLPEKEGWERYFTNLREFQEASTRHNIPFWTTLLCAGHFYYRCPTEDDLRWQLNTAIAHGAKGILWFFFYMRYPHQNYRLSPIDEHNQRTETFYWLSRVNKTFLRWHSGLIQNLTLKKVFHTKESWGNIPLLDGSGLVYKASSTQPLIVSEFVDPQGRPYISVVNNSQKENTLAEICVKGNQPVLYHIGWDEKEQEVSDCKKGMDFFSVSMWLAPGQLELYRVEFNKN